VYDDIGKLILRATLSILMLFHGIAKLRTGVSGVEGLLQSHGLPGLLAYGVFIGEVLAPLLVLIGVYARIGALIMAFSMFVAILLAHTSQLADFTQGGGWALELQAFFLFTAMTVFLIGPGKFSIDRR